MFKLLGNRSRGLIFVLSAPAGTGKTTLVQKLIAEFPCIIQSISFTTRSRRYNEISGDHYHFISKEEFEKKISEHDFLEYVKLYGDYYGTSKKWVESQLSQGKHVFLVIDTQGALQLMESLDACFIFLEPPSLEALRHRLTNRKTDSPEAIAKRLEWAVKEMEAVRYYQYRIVNDDLACAYQILRSIVIAEEHKVRDF
jgi:guanylate kinase